MIVFSCAPFLRFSLSVTEELGKVPLDLTAEEEPATQLLLQPFVQRNSIRAVHLT